LVPGHLADRIDSSRAFPPAKLSQVIGDILQPTHLIFVLVVALLVLGPKRLPEVGRSLGRGLRDFRDAMSGEDRDRPDEMTARTTEPGFTTTPDSEVVLTPTSDSVVTPDTADSTLPANDVVMTPESDAVLASPHVEGTTSAGGEAPHAEKDAVVSSPHAESTPAANGEAPQGASAERTAPVSAPAERVG
jgi:sec-independent protein translocase protein TatA